MKKTGRNDPCPCGSGKKYKVCCLGTAAVQAPVAHPEDSISARLQSAIEHHRSGRLAQAEVLYQALLAEQPDNPDALHFLGVIAHQQGNHTAGITLITQAISLNPNVAAYYSHLGSAWKGQGNLDTAITCYQKALALNPDFAEAHYNLGNTLNLRVCVDEAIDCYRKAIALKPDYFDALNALAKALYTCGKLDEVISCYRQAVMLQPDQAEVHNNLGAVLHAQGKPEDALASYRRAVALNPEYAEAHTNLGGSLLALGKIREAVDSFQMAISLNPDNALARHLVAALTGTTTDAPPGGYVEKLFDGYADKFDQALVHTLGYTMPKQLVQWLSRCIDCSGPTQDILDLGCGTGLFGLEALPFARHLVGVDLSSQMLAKARMRNIYHRLEHADLVSMMRNEQAASYDLIVAADVFVYLGRLDEVVAEARRLLRVGGCFAFSVESLDEHTDHATGPERHLDYKLNQSGRYSHAAHYLDNLSVVYQFKSLCLSATTVRLEKGEPIAAWVAVWQG